MTLQHLTDRMPDVRHGRDGWTDADLDHLARCGDCALEWRVIRSVAVQDIASLDPDQLAAEVLARLHRAPAILLKKPRSAWGRSRMALAAAASIALAFLVWPASPGRESALVPGREATMLPELDALVDAELEVVLASLTEEPADPIGEVPRMGDLTDDELEQLLEEVEG